MKIVAVLGSSRLKGNSATMARRLVETAKQSGADAEVYELNEMNFKGCQGCESCKTVSECCVIEDDLTPVYASIYTTDVLVMASPVYFGDISGQLKCFFDRTYAFADPDFSSRLAPGKKTVFILAQGAPEVGMFNDIHPRYERWLKMFGFSPNYLIWACGVRKPGEVEEQVEVMRRAEDVARTLMEL